MRYEYVITVSFVSVVLKQSCVLDSWLGDDSSSSFSFVESVLVERMFCCS